MRTGIASLSVRGRLLDKLPAIAEAGFDGIEIFDNDLISCPAAPREIAARVADLGLRIDLFQPFRDAAGLDPATFGSTLRRFRAKAAVAAELGAPVLLACSHVGPEAVDDADLLAEQLYALGEAAAEFDVKVAYEALAWGKYVNRVGQAYEGVRGADHPAVTLAVDTFHILARGDDAGALAGVPGDRIGFLQVADGPLLQMDLLEWSRHFRCFPGQGGLDVAGVVAATVEAGYRGPVSLEIFSDVVREADPYVTARDGYRSLVFLEDQVAARLSEPTAAATCHRPAPAPARTDLAFLELGNAGAPQTEELLSALGFVRAAEHRSKRVSLWRNGTAQVVLNDTAEATADGLGVITPRIADVADRAKALLWPAVEHRRGDGESRLPGITAPSGLPVYLSADPGTDDDWRRDFLAVSDETGDGWSSIDHVGVTVPAHRFNEEIGFLRTVFDLVPGRIEEFWEPDGRMRSRALRPRSGDLRLVVNVEEVGSRRSREGITQVAFACDDLPAKVRRLRERGVPLMAVPDNYYRDLGARWDLPDRRVEELRELGILYDRSPDGELLHVYTEVLDTGFYVELLERRGGYDGYGAANTHVRLASQGFAGIWER